MRGECQRMVSGAVNRDCQPAGTPRPQGPTFPSPDPMTDNDQIFDLAYEHRQQRKAEAAAQAEIDDRAVEQEVTRSRGRTSWAAAAEIRVALGLVLPAIEDVRYRPIVGAREAGGSRQVSCVS
jgi:hypothetical protein